MASYIDPVDGSDANPGTQLLPRLTPPSASNGESFLFKCGTTYTRISQWDWSTFANITLSAYGSGAKPIITITTTSSSAINIKGTGIHNVNNIHFKDCFHPTIPATASPHCLSFGATGTQDASDGASGIITDCDFSGIGGNAILFNGISGSAAAAYAAPTGIVQRCTFNDIGDDCVFAKVRTYFEVSYCTMRGMSARTTTGDGVGFLDANPALAWIHHNYIDHSNLDYKQCIMIDGVNGSGYALIEDNICVGFGSESVRAESHVVVNVDACTSVIRRNKLRGYGLLIAVNTGGETINSNIIESYNYRTDNTAAITFLCSNVSFQNNTLIAGAASGKLIESGSSRSGIVLKNNLAVNANTFYKQGSATTTTYDYNCTYAITNPYLDSAGAPLSAGTHDVTSNPNLIGYELGANSPCIGTGTTVDVTDYNGERFTEGKQDMGALRANQGMRPAGLRKSIIRQSKLQ